jgi:ketosteroid isomerase-like protein
MAPPSAPAGWYPDPDRPGQQRWWDGAQWSRPSEPPQAPALEPKTPSPNAQALRRYYELFNDGSPAAWEFFHPGIEWIPAPGFTVHGPGAAIAAIQRVRGRLKAWHLEPSDVAEWGPHLLVTVREHKRKRIAQFASGKETTNDIGHLWSIQAGRAIRFEFFPTPDAGRGVFDAMCREAAATGAQPGVGALGPAGVPLPQGGRWVGGAWVGVDIGDLFG